MALGATRGRIAGMILADIGVVCGAGLVAGAVVTAMLTSSIRSLLYATSPLNPGLVLLAAATIVIVAGIAGYVPSRRAARLDPMRALRHE